MGKIGPLEIVLILLVVVLLFGGRKIPELMKGIGQGLKEFKKAKDTDTHGYQERYRGDKVILKYLKTEPACECRLFISTGEQ